MNRRMKILVIGSDLAVMAILASLLVNLTTIPLLSPVDRSYTTDRKPEFSWGGMQGEYLIFLDASPDFAAPMVAKVPGNSYETASDLDFGTYYWKVESGPISSAVGKFTIGSSVVLSRSGEEVRNGGNAEILLSGPSITGAFVLGINKSASIGANENVKAEQA